VGSRWDKMGESVWGGGINDTREPPRRVRHEGRVVAASLRRCVRVTAVLGLLLTHIHPQQRHILPLFSPPRLPHTHTMVRPIPPPHSHARITLSLTLSPRRAPSHAAYSSAEWFAHDHAPSPSLLSANTPFRTRSRRSVDISCSSRMWRYRAVFLQVDQIGTTAPLTPRRGSPSSGRRSRPPRRGPKLPRRRTRRCVGEAESSCHLALPLVLESSCADVCDLLRLIRITCIALILHGHSVLLDVSHLFGIGVSLRPSCPP
jgi:hypothetical protein